MVDHTWHRRNAGLFVVVCHMWQLLHPELGIVQESPAFRAFKALTFPLLNGYNILLHPLSVCIMSSCKHLDPSCIHVVLMSITTSFQRSIWTQHLECSCIFETQKAISTNTSVSVLANRLGVQIAAAQIIQISS